MPFARRLHVATIANDLNQYAHMRASMEAVGYNQQQCRFTLFDNSNGNSFEPYSVLRQLATDGDEPYIILCHQDLLFDQTSGLEVLTRHIAKLDAIDPRWCLAGNAGADRHGQLVIHMDDPNGNHRSVDLPRQVISLDENFLLLRRDRYVLPSPSLKGFHFYGTDLCLNALLQRMHAYVIELPVKHLSAGQPLSEAYLSARREMMDLWRPRLLIGLVKCLPAEFRVSRWPWLEWVLNHRIPAGVLRRFGLSLVMA